MKVQTNSKPSFAIDGAQRLPEAATNCLSELLDALAEQPTGRPGVRLYGNSELRRLLGSGGKIGKTIAAISGQTFRPVRAILFDKSPENNWSLAWHQDRTICVRNRVEVNGFGPWTIKAGKLHVAPPFELLSRMITIRIHLDDVSALNAPQLISPGSHKVGRVADEQIDDVVRELGTFACLANAGDIWLYSTPILHASERAADASARRVLQVDLSPDTLPGGLQWEGV